MTVRKCTPGFKFTLVILLDVLDILRIFLFLLLISVQVLVYGFCRLYQDIRERRTGEKVLVRLESLQVVIDPADDRINLFDKD